MPRIGQRYKAIHGTALIEVLQVNDFTGVGQGWDVNFLWLDVDPKFEISEINNFKKGLTCNLDCAAFMFLFKPANE